MTHRHSILVALLAAAALWSAAPASAQSARAYLESKHEQVNRLLRQPARSESARQRRSARLTRMLNELLDYEALSRDALSDHWDDRSEEERERFVSLLRQLVERNYENNLEQILDYEVSYDGERRRGEDTVVTTSARSRENRRQPPVEIEYTMRRTGGQWRVVDVTTDGVSMVDNYRNQFNRIIERESWDALVERMERRLEEGADG